MSLLERQSVSVSVTCSSSSRSLLPIKALRSYIRAKEDQGCVVEEVRSPYYVSRTGCWRSFLRVNSEGVLLEYCGREWEEVRK